MPEKMGYAHDVKPEPKVPSVKEESYDDMGAPASEKSGGSSFSKYLKEAKAECDREHTKLDGVATRENNGGMSYGGGQSRDAVRKYSGGKLPANYGSESKTGDDY